MPKFEDVITESITNAFRASKAQSLLLGGHAGSGGGSGGPPGGFVGQLPQGKITYDLSELSTDYIPASGMSIVDNLNHIRYRVSQLEAGSGISAGHTIKDETTTYPARTYLEFAGAAVVSDDSGADTTIVTISTTGSGGGGGHTIQNEGSNMTPRDYLNFVGDGVNVTDDSGNNRTIVTISGGGGGLPWFNVKDYGAVGDGIADDSTAVSNTIIALNAVNSGVLYFPAGTYRILGEYIINANCTVMGDGASMGGQYLDSYWGTMSGMFNSVSLIQLKDNYRDYVFTQQNGDFFEVRDLAFACDRNYGVAQGGVNCGWENTNYQRRMIVHDCSFIGFNNAIAFYDGNHCEARNNYLIVGDYSGIAVGESDNFVIDGNTILATNDMNLFIEVNWYTNSDTTMHGRITNNVFGSVYSEDMEYYDGYIVNDGIEIDVPGFTEWSMDISGNNFFGGIYSTAILFYPSYDGVRGNLHITNNNIRCNAGYNGTYGYGIEVYGLGVDNSDIGGIIANNTFHSVKAEATKPAIHLRHSKNITVVGNVNDNFAGLVLADEGSTDINIIDLARISVNAVPGSSDDKTIGHSAGDIWVDTGNSPDTYVCTDNSVGAAVWNKIVD